MKINSHAQEIFGAEAVEVENIDFDPKEEKSAVHQNLTDEENIEFEIVRHSDDNDVDVDSPSTVKELSPTGPPAISDAEKLRRVNSVLEFLVNDEDSQALFENLRQLRDRLRFRANTGKQSLLIS